MTKLTTIGLDLAKNVFQVHGTEFACPEVRARARFHPDQTHRQVRKELHHLRTLQCLAQQRLASLVRQELLAMHPARQEEPSTGTASQKGR